MIRQHHKKSKTSAFLSALGTGVLALAGCGAPQDKPGAEATAPISAETKVGAYNRDTRLELRTQPRQLQPGQIGIWTLNVWQGQGNERVKAFDLTQGKMMHVFVVSKDLSYFNHLVPEYKDDGLFITDTVLPVGNYKVYAAYTPHKGTREVAQRELSVTSSGGALHPISVAPALAPGQTMAQRVQSTPAGKPDATGGESYQVSLQAMPPHLIAGQDATLHFEVHDSANRPVTDLQPDWEAPGIAVVLSANGNIFVPAVPTQKAIGGDGVAPATGPDVIFRVRFPKAGLYKVWGQFKRNNTEITAPFVLNVRAM